MSISPLLLFFKKDPFWAIFFGVYRQEYILCQIMYKWILKISEYWTKGNIIGWPDTCRPNWPRYSLFFNIPLFFNIHLYMIWHFSCSSSTKTVSVQMLTSGYFVFVKPHGDISWWESTCTQLLQKYWSSILV